MRKCTRREEKAKSSVRKTLTTWKKLSKRQQEPQKPFADESKRNNNVAKNQTWISLCLSRSGKKNRALGQTTCNSMEVLALGRRKASPCKQNARRGSNKREEKREREKESSDENGNRENNPEVNRVFASKGFTAMRNTRDFRLSRFPMCEIIKAGNVELAGESADEEKWTKRIVERVITRRRGDGDEISGNEKFSFSSSRKRRLFIFINEVGSKEKEREREERWNKWKRSAECW